MKSLRIVLTQASANNGILSNAYTEIAKAKVRGSSFKERQGIIVYQDTLLQEFFNLKCEGLSKSEGSVYVTIQNKRIF